MKYLQGQLLIAAPTLEDPNFSRSVVLLVRHNEEGALGLILNRPLETTVQEAIEGHVNMPVSVEGVLHQGGPCEGPLMAVHGQEYASETQVMDGMYFCVERDKVEWLLVNDASGGKMRFFVGYSGWEAGQLENEMERGSWMLMPGSEEAVFGGDPDLWSRLITQSALGKFVDPKRIPDDPSMN